MPTPKLNPADLTRQVLLELRDWARAGGDLLLARECTIALTPADHPERYVEAALIRCALAWNARGSDTSDQDDDEVTELIATSRVTTPRTQPEPTMTIDEIDQLWRAQRATEDQ